jgi:hypothetical protein
MTVQNGELVRRFPSSRLEVRRRSERHQKAIQRSRGAALCRAWAVAALVLCAAGCSLVSIKSPEKPLSTRDLNARILTREYSHRFVTAVAECADDIAATDPSTKIQADALRWKISAATESTRAATQMAPMMSWLDTWALASQMRAFLAPGGRGSTLFGAHQSSAFAVAEQLDAGALDLAQRVVEPGQFARYRAFVETYTREHPLENLDFVRPSVVELWIKSTGSEVKLVDSLGTLSEAMADASDRVKISTDAIAEQSMWRTELALRQSGYSATDIRDALKQLDDRLSKVSAAAQNSPQLVHDAVDQVRQSVLQVLDRVDAASATVLKGIMVQREALFADVRTERAAMMVAADEQRRAIVSDATRLAEQIVKQSGEEARRLVRQMLIFLILLALVVLGIPFAAGYAAGRARRDRHRPE